ncbi:helix-turn-helix domain-containing protein, partial [Methylophaga sp. UBA4204]
LELLLRESPNVVSRQRLEIAIWGEEVPDSDSLKVHLHHLRKTIDGGFDTGLLQTIPGIGIAIRADNES